MRHRIRRSPKDDIDESELEVGHPKDSAAGVSAVAVSMKRSIEQMGVTRATRTLLKLNQADGFDCQGCAWPDPAPEHRHTAEFCENGVKAVTDEVTLRRVGREFFAAHSIEELAGRTELGFPPAMRVAAVDGSPEAVNDLLDGLELPEGGEVLGPVPLGEVDEDGGAERERAIVRVERTRGRALADALRSAQAVRSSKRPTDRIRVQVDPLELL